MSEHVLRVERLSVKRGGRTILSDLSLAVDGGELVGIVGKG